MGGFDCNETFAPFAKMTSVRAFQVVVVAKKWEIHQMDANNTFLHGNLEWEVYMTLPPGFGISNSNKVFKLQKSLYGLK